MTLVQLTLRCGLTLVLLGTLACGPAVRSGKTGDTLGAGLVRAVYTEPAGVAAYIVNAGQGQLFLIDAGMDKQAENLKAELTRMGHSPDDVIAIVLTHGHGDHVSGAVAFPKAQVYALADEVDLIEGRAVAERPLPSLSGPSPTGVTVTHALNDGDVVLIGEVSVEVFAVAGHTPGSAALLVHKVLFLGDAAVALEDGTLGEVPWFLSSDVEQSRASMRALMQRLKPRSQEIRALACSHSAALENGLAPLEQYLSDQSMK